MAPFLTDLDDRAAVKGSRDPLGIQAIWTRFGRHVVHNLTTVSSSVRDFTTLLLGYWLVERVAETGARGAELATFLKWEQLAAYARAAVNKDLSFRGVERVVRNLNEGPRIVLSAERTYQILGDQKIYGLWGLYTVPARASGLIETDPPRLSEAARDFVERQYLPALADAAGREARSLVKLLGESAARLDVRGKDARLIEAVARVLKPRIPAKERAFYREALVYGGPDDRTQGRQRALADLLLAPPFAAGAFAWSPPAVGQLAKTARIREGEASVLAYRLDRIRHCETLVAPAATLFSFLLARDGATVPEVAAVLRERWGARVTTLDVAGVESLKTEIGAAANDPAVGERWVRFGERLSVGDYVASVQLLLEQNRHVMKSRSGAAPWAEEQDGRLMVRFHDEGGNLPAREDLPELWRFPYFLDSLRAVTRALKEG
ncbi:hypothetical protein WMF31_38155 [Sorangium sp. So ce1036]|uniref:hypothetical protein n=1 Tax=Sorangium sp. So ce1036 TaxID=3133328 RepID=UPI003F017F72